MPLHIVENDITKMQVDAIVNSTNEELYGYSGVDRIIHLLGGDELEAECEKLRNTCVLGEAIYTNAYNLPCKYLIHTICPIWNYGRDGDEAILRSCYRKSLEVAGELGVNSLAFPLISAGSMGFPIAKALANAVTTISEYLALYGEELDVYLVLHGAVVTQIAETMFGDLDNYITENFKALDLEKMIEQPGESFVDMLYRFMDEKGIDKPSQVYKRANMSKATYSKLISGGSKKPSLETAVGLAMALRLTYDEAVEFFASAGIALSNSSKFDMIVAYFLKTQNYDTWEMDVQLLKYGYKTIFSSY